MSAKTTVIISNLVDATIKEGQPDIDFKIFHTIQDFAEFLDSTPIRAELLFFTKDVIGTSNTSFNYLREVLQDNVYCSIDRVIYITEEDSKELTSLKYLIDEFDLSNWEAIRGPLQRSFITEVIHGTFRDDDFNEKRKVIIRKPRADYVKQKLKTYDSMEENYVADEEDLMDIEDVDIPEVTIAERPQQLSKVFISGMDTRERTAMAYLTSQYLSRTHKTIILESDVDYHRLTEFHTKSGVEALMFTVTDLYEDAAVVIDAIKKTDSTLIVIGCIDRVTFNYKYLIELLYYNLINDVDYFVIETDIKDIPSNTVVTLVLPSTVTGLLEGAEKIDKSITDYCHFVSINLQDLPETHVNSGLVCSNILNDLLTTCNAICPVLTVNSLKLSGSAYDFGHLLGGVS